MLFRADLSSRAIKKYLTVKICRRKAVSLKCAVQLLK